MDKASIILKINVDIDTLYPPETVSERAKLDESRRRLQSKAERLRPLFKEYLLADQKTPARGEPMPRTVEHYQANALRDQELILEQKAEIEALKQTVNQLRQK